MASKAVFFLAIFLAAFVLILSEVSARDLVETTHSESSTKTDQYGGGPGYGRGGYGGGPGYGRGGYGGGPGYGRGGYGGRGRCGGYGCCGRGGYYGCRCCAYAGEKPDAGYKPENENDVVKAEVKP